MPAEKSIRSPIMWFFIGALVIVACTVAARLEDTTLMRVLFYAGAGVGFICAIINIFEVRGVLRQRRRKNVTNDQDEDK